MTSKFDHIDDLMISVLSGNADAQEFATLKEWISESADHQRYFRLMTDAWFAASIAGDLNSFDAVTGFKTFVGKVQPIKPAANVIDQFVAKIQGQFDTAQGVEDKMEIIMQQKYIHHNIMNIYELWAEQRRTRHPKIEKITANGVTYDPVPERLMYPNSEAQTNSENLKTVVDQNNFTTPIFWVTDNKKTESLYMDGYFPLTGYLPL